MVVCVKVHVYDCVCDSRLVNTGDPGVFLCVCVFFFLYASLFVYVRLCDCVCLSDCICM